MNENVKLFIEQEIHLIETEKWEDLFIRWYDTYHMCDINADRVQLKEFFDILQTAGFGDVSSMTAEIRKNLIIKYMNDYIDKMKLLQEDFVRVVGAMNSLNSRLACSLIELKHIFVEVCEQRGLKPTCNLKTQFEL